MTKHEAVKAYFEPKVEELAGSLLNFNFSPEAPDSISLITNYSGADTVSTFVSKCSRI